MGKYLLIFLLTTSSLLAQFELIIDPIETTQQAGVPFILSVRLVDAGGNPVGFDVSCNLFLLTPDLRHELLSPNEIRIVNGVVSIMCTVFYASGGLTIYANAGAWVDTSNVFTVQPGSFERVMGLLPGQSPDPGNRDLRGRKHSALPVISGEEMEIVVCGTDLYWNPLDVSAIPFTITSTDTFIAPISGTINNGLDTLQIIPRVAGHHTLFVSGNDAITDDTSTVFQVVAGEYKKLLLLVPPYQHIPGTRDGYNAVLRPSDWSTAKPETISIYTTDEWWNAVNVTANIEIRGTDISPPINISVEDGYTRYLLVFHSPGWKGIRAKDVGSGFESPTMRFEVKGMATDDLPPIFAYPNPMRDNTTILFHLSEEGTVEVVIYDVFGYRVWEKERSADQLRCRELGRYKIEWNGRTGGGVKVANGIYTVRVINMVGGTVKDNLKMSIGVMR